MAFLSRKKDTKPTTQPAPVPAGPSDVFFGTLRSEFDTPDELPEPFKVAFDAFDRLVNDYRAGNVSADIAAGALSRMILVDHNGMEWTVGATTLRWHRRLPGGAWRSAIPPQHMESEQMSEEARALSVRVDQILRSVHELKEPAVVPSNDANVLDVVVEADVSGGSTAQRAPVTSLDSLDDVPAGEQLTFDPVVLPGFEGAPASEPFMPMPPAGPSWGVVEPESTERSPYGQ